MKAAVGDEVGVGLLQPTRETAGGRLVDPLGNLIGAVVMLAGPMPPQKLLGVELEELSSEGVRGELVDTSATRMTSTSRTVSRTFSLVSAIVVWQNNEIFHGYTYTNLGEIGWESAVVRRARSTQGVGGLPVLTGRRGQGAQAHQQADRVCPARGQDRAELWP